MNESGCDLFWVHCFALLLFKLPLRCDDDDDDKDNDYDDSVYDENTIRLHHRGRHRVLMMATSKSESFKAGGLV